MVQRIAALVTANSNFSVDQIATATHVPKKIMEALPGPGQIGDQPVVGPQARNGGLCPRSGGLVPPDAV
jgi:hypothetical protein